MTFLIAVLLLATSATAAHASDAKVTDEKKVTERILELTIETPAFVAPTKVQVNLPTGYDADASRHWPVTYILAGTMNSYRSFNSFLDGEGLTEDYPSITVQPDPKSGYWSDWYNGGAFGPPMYETWVIDQLIPLIDTRFRTIPKREGRAVSGVSMGGYGTMMFAARHPELFVAAASLSGAVDSNLPANGAVLSASSTFDGAEPDAIYGPRASQEVRWHGHNPTDLAANLRGMHLQVRTANGVPNPGIGEDPGSADSVSCVVEGGVHMASVNFHEKLDELGIAHVWKDYGAGCHTKPNFERQVVETFDMFKQVLAKPAPAPSVFEFASIEPEFDVWGWHVAADPARALEFMRMNGSPFGLDLVGSGLTTVTTPAWYRNLKAVDVGGKPVAPRADGRLQFKVDLGAAHTTQQYTPGGGTDFATQSVRFAPHAVIRITKAKRVKRGVRVCARALGGEVPRARIAAGRRGIVRKISAKRSCHTVAGGPAKKVKIRGRDRFGHRVQATRMIKRRPGGL